MNRRPGIIKRFKSSTTNKVNKYIQTWLGSDLKGDAYTRQIANGGVNTSTAQSSSSMKSPQSMQESSQTLLDLKTTQIRTCKIYTPVLNIDWTSTENLQQLQEDLINSKSQGISDSLLNEDSTILIDFSSIPKDMDINQIDKIMGLVRKSGLIPIAALNSSQINTTTSTTTTTEFSLPKMQHSLNLHERTQKHLH